MKGKYKNHNQSILTEQSLYLETRNDNHLVNMYYVFIEMGSNMIKDYITRKKLIWTKEDIEIKAHDMATFVIQRFLTDKDFFIHSTPSGYFRNSAFLKIMFQYSHIEKLSKPLEVIKND